MWSNVPAICNTIKVNSMNFIKIERESFLNDQKLHLAVSETLYCDFLRSRDPRFLRVLLILRVFPESRRIRLKGDQVRPVGNVETILARRESQRENIRHYYH